MNRIAMRRLGLGLFLGLLMVGLNTMPAWGVNSVVIAQPDSVGTGAQDTIFIKITNEVEVSALVVPLIIRTLHGTAFFSALAISRNPADRMTLLTDLDGNSLGALTGIKTLNRLVDSSGVQNGSCKNGQPGGFKTIYTSGAFISPTAVLFVCGQIDPTDPNDLTLAPGSDSTFGSLRMIITSSGDGQFEVDTTCTNPANHLQFNDPNNGTYTPQFTTGIVKVGSGSAVYDLGAGTGGIPKDYTLGQNYPNPFNAGTVIQFATKVAGHVRLDVFNILGQKVTTLVDQSMDYGLHAADWDGKDVTGRPVPTGLYFYRLSTNDFTAVKKMVLIK